MAINPVGKVINVATGEDRWSTYSDAGKMWRTAAGAVGGITAAPAAAPLIGLGYAMGGNRLLSGLESQNEGKKALEEINKTPYPDFSIGKEVQGAYDKSLARQNQGFTGQEEAAFKQNLAMDNNARYRRGITSGGGSQTVQAGINYGNQRALGQFAMSDAQLQRQNMAQTAALAQIIQQEQNRATQQKADRRMQLEQAYGMAIARGQENQLAGEEALGNTALKLGSMAAGLPPTGGIGGGTQQSTMTTPTPSYYYDDNTHDQ